MGKRAHVPPTDLQNYVTSPLKKCRSIRKRKVNNHGNTGPLVRSAKASRLNNDLDEDEDDEESSSSNDAHLHNCSTKQANNSSILLNSSLKVHGVEQISLTTNESPRPVYSLRPSVVNGTILYDLKQKPWRLGSPIGKGNFGEIFLASDNITVPVTNDSAKYVVKIEPHSNGPLFVEIHCILNTAKKQENPSLSNEIKLEYEAPSKQSMNTVPSGIPDYIASGSHYFGDARYRFLVLQRFDQDLHSIIKNSCVSQKSLLILAIQIVNVLENLHDKGYCHNDVKSQNLMISKCKYYKKQGGATNNDLKLMSIKSKFEDNYDERQLTTDSGNSSEQDAHDDDDYNYETDFVVKRRPHYCQDTEDDEDFNDGTTTSNSNSNSIDIYKTPVMRNNKRRRVASRPVVQYSGSNPVRSCRRQQTQNSIYEEMVNSHYLRPSKRISYSEFFADDGTSVKGDIDGDSRDTNFNSAEDDDSIGFAPKSVRRRITASNNSFNKKSNSTQRTVKTLKTSPSCKRLTRRQEKILLEEKQQQQHQQKSSTLSHFSSVGMASQQPPAIVSVEAEHIFLIDFGLASKYIDNGVHRPFVMDQRRAHDGTLEFTSRDAHMGAHSRRSDLECLGYNLIFWSQGFLPWKEAAAQQQQEKVHRAKEYLMADVREMLKLVYGKDVPKYLGEFLHLVGHLAYHERPQYSRYRRLFEREYQQLGYSLTNICLDSQEIVRTCVRIKKDHGVGKHDFFEQNNKLVNNNVLSIMKSGGTPFQERNSLGDRVSPKNLRSKSDKKASRKKKFSWAEVLSQDPDQIARERAEKEFDREINDEEDRPVRRYKGKPTYAILELLQKYGERMDQDDRNLNDDEEQDDEDGDTDGEDIAEDEDQDEEDTKKDENEEDSDVFRVDDDDEEDQEDTDKIEISDKDDNESDEKSEACSDDHDNDDDDIGMEVCEEDNSRISKRNRRQRMQTKVKSKPNKTTKVPTIKNRNSNKKSDNSTTTAKRLKIGLSKSSRKHRCVRTSSPFNVESKMTTKEKPAKQRCVTRKNTRKTTTTTTTRQTSAASAAGEIEQQEMDQYLLQQQSQNGNHKRYHHHTLSNSRGGGASGISERREKYERPKRRCPIKTDATNGNTGGNGRMHGVEDDSNSNFSPDVRILFNVWKKMSNENIYAKSAATAAAANRKVSNGGGGMVTRHYRK